MTDEQIISHYQAMLPLIEKLIDARQIAVGGTWVNVGPMMIDNVSTRYEIRQEDTKPTDKYHWPFRVCETIQGQTSGADKDNFDFIAIAANVVNELKNIIDGETL